MNNIIIYKMSSLDIDKVVKLQEANNENIISRLSIEEDIRNSGSIYYLANFGEEIVGYIAAKVLVDHIDILSVLVDEKHKRQGIASTLINNIVEYSKANKLEIFLEVRESNTAAKNLYTKFNFKEISIRKDYYNNPVENAIIYKLDLTK